MSIDTVDDLHAAEDYGGTLHEAARALVDYYHADPNEMDPEADDYRDGIDWDDLDELVRRLDAASQEPFIRPSCRAGICEEDCGGYHPETEKGTEQQ